MEFIKKALSDVIGASHTARTLIEKAEEEIAALLKKKDSAVSSLNDAKALYNKVVSDISVAREDWDRVKKGEFEVLAKQKLESSGLLQAAQEKMKQAEDFLASVKQKEQSLVSQLSDVAGMKKEYQDKLERAKAAIQSI